jgi:hypothetical protein
MQGNLNTLSMDEPISKEVINDSLFYQYLSNGWDKESTG